MKLTHLSATFVALLVLSATAADTIKYDGLTKTNEMLLVGSATGHEWKVKGVIISGFFETDAAWQTDPSLKSVTCLGEGKAPKCEVNIPIRSLKSQVAVGSSIMDGRMQKELKMAQFPKIEYKLTEMKVKGEVPASGSPVTFDAKGKLAIAGVTNDVSFPITMERIGKDQLKFAGSYQTKMTAFSVTPPEFTLMGIGSKTADDIKLTWTWMTGVKSE